MKAKVRAIIESSKGNKIPPDNPKPPEPKRKPGRPEDYTLRKAQKICQLVATTTKGIKEICETNSGMPNPDTVYLWLFKHPEFSEMYRDAKRYQMEVLNEQCRQIADTPRPAMVIKEKRDPVDKTRVLERETTTTDAIRHRELQISTRHWEMGRLAPERFGEKVQVETRGDSIQDLIDQFKQRHDDIVKAKNGGQA